MKSFMRNDPIMHIVLGQNVMKISIIFPLFKIIFEWEMTKNSSEILYTEFYNSGFYNYLTFKSLLAWLIRINCSQNFTKIIKFIYYFSAMSIAESSKLPGYGEGENGSVNSFTLSHSSSASSFSSATSGPSSRNSSFTQRAGHHPMWKQLIVISQSAKSIPKNNQKNPHATTPLRIQVRAQPLT